MITADLYPVIAKTLEFRVTVAETPLRFGSLPAPVSAVQYFKEHKSLPSKLGGALTKLREAITEALSREARPSGAQVTSGTGEPLRGYDREYIAILSDLDTRLQVSMDKKTSVITITGTMPDRYASANLVQTASERLMERIIEYESQKAGEQLRFVEQQYQERGEVYEQAQRRLAVFTDRNRSLNSPVALIEKERLQRENDVAFQVLEQVSLELAQARIRKNQDTPVFAVLEKPTVPDHRSSPRRMLILLVWVVAGVAAGAIRILWPRLVGPTRPETSSAAQIA